MMRGVPHQCYLRSTAHRKHACNTAIYNFHASIQDQTAVIISKWILHLYLAILIKCVTSRQSSVSGFEQLSMFRLLLPVTTCCCCRQPTVTMLKSLADNRSVIWVSFLEQCEPKNINAEFVASVIVLNWVSVRQGCSQPSLWLHSWESIEVTSCMQHPNI